MTSEILWDNWGRPTQIPGVYDDFDNFFRLTYKPEIGDPVKLDIDEPPGWPTLRLTLARSAEWHAVNYEYSSSEKSLEFNGDSGRDFIQSIFLSEGEDATILLDFGLRGTGFEVIEYQGRLNLATYQNGERRVSCALERATLQSRVDAKWDQQVSVLSVLSLNNKIIPPPVMVDIPLSAQSLEERFVCNAGAGRRIEQTFSGDTDGHVWFQFDTSQPQVSEIEELAAGKQAGMSDSSGPIDNDEYLFKFRSGGTRLISFYLAYRVWWTIKKKAISFGAAYVTGYTMGTYLTLVKANGSKTNYPIGDVQTVGSRAGQKFRQSEVAVSVDGKVSLSLNTEVGDKLYLYGLLSFDTNKNELQQTQLAFQVTTTQLSITGRSQNTASSAKGFALIDALSASLTVITGLPDRFRSAFYGLKNDRYPVDGCGARRVLMNGFAIRNFKPTEKPLSLSLRDALQSLQAIDCMGLAYRSEIQPDGSLLDVVQVDPIEHYYRPVELLRLDEVGNYQERTVTDQLFSTLEVGYSDWISEGTGALEEIFTTHQVQTPIRHEQAKKSIVSKLITSSLAIERTRREQYDTTQKDGTTYDDKAFLIQCKPIPAFRGPAQLIYDSFLGVSLILLDTSIPWLAKGTKASFSGSAANDGTYAITFVSDQNRRPWSFYVAGQLTDENVNELVISATGGLDLQPEIGDDFAQVTGLISGSDTYNLRLTPARMLLRNTPVWAGALLGKQGAVNNILPPSYPYQGRIVVSHPTSPLGAILPFSRISLDESLTWITPGQKIVLTGPTANIGSYTVLTVSDPTIMPWVLTVVAVLTPETVGSVVITLPDQVPTGDQVTKTRLPGNAKVTTVLPPDDSCGQAGIVRENAPIDVDQLLPHLLYRPREITFSVRLSRAQLQRLRLGSLDLLPTDIGPDGKPINPNGGYVSLLNQEGIRVAGYLMSCDYSPLDGNANFVLRQTALDLNDTTSGLDCTQFVGWTLAQAETADARTRRRIELCRWIDVDPS